MMKPTRKTISIANLVVDLNLNVRDVNNYDLEQMMDQIREAGRILKPIIVRAEDKKVLSGNRRTLAGQKLLQQADLPSDLKEALSKVDVIEYAGLEPEEELRLIMDHGSEKPISRAEIVKAVWRLDKSFYSESQIISLMYYALAKFTGNERKLSEIPKEGKARADALKKWLHGTVGNYILSAGKMGDFIREQMVKTMLSEDNLLPKEDKIEMRISRERITQLSAAKQKDARDATWDPVNGGPDFNKLIQQFKDEDNGNGPADKKSRPTSKELKEKADLYSSSIRKALLIAAGETGETVQGLADDDARISRMEKVSNMLGEYFDQVEEPYKTFINIILDKPLLEVEAFLKSVVKKS